MKTKKVLAIIIALLIAATTVVSVSAERISLTDQDPSGKTEVIAHISANPGNVTYLITIPDVVDFGELAQPAEDVDSFTAKPYTVSLDEVEGLNPETQEIAVYVRDENAEISVDHDQEFYITNKADSSKQFSYDVYNSYVETPTFSDAEHKVNNNVMPRAIGYYLYGFTQVGQEVNGSLVLNQRQLYPYVLPDIVGDYSGYMVFYSAVVSTQ